MLQSLWSEAVETPPYPTYELVRAKGGETTYRLDNRTGFPVSAYEDQAKVGELLRDPDLRFIPDWTKNLVYRTETLARCAESEEYQELQMLFCRSSILYFTNTFCWTSDPRLDYHRSPFVTYPFQDDLLCWLLDRIKSRTPGLIEKSRDMGCSWLLLVIAAYCSIFYEGFVEYLLSMTEKQVDNRQLGSLLEKLRFIIKNLPLWMQAGWAERGHGIDTKMMISFPDTTSVVEGLLTGGSSQAGRSGRAKISAYDEFAFVEDQQKVRKAAASLSACQIYLSTANGMGNEFYRMRENNAIARKSLHWSLHPLKNKDWSIKEKAKMSIEDWAQEHEIDYSQSTKSRVFYEFLPYTTSEYDWSHIQMGTYFEFDPHFPVYCGLDFGIRDPTSAVFAQIKPAPLAFQAFTKECLIFFGEKEETDMMVDQWAEYILACGYDFRNIVGDYRTGNQRDATGKTWIRYMRSHGIHVEGKYNTEAAPIIVTQKLLRTPGALAVNKVGCPNLIKSFQNWSYPVDKDTGLVDRNASPKHNQFSHSMKAVCYLNDFLYGTARKAKSDLWDDEWDYRVMPPMRNIMS